MRQNGKFELQHELSWFLVAYLAMILGVLLAVHLVQPRGASDGMASRVSTELLR